MVEEVTRGAEERIEPGHHSKPRYYSITVEKWRKNA